MSQDDDTIKIYQLYDPEELTLYRMILSKSPSISPTHRQPCVLEVKLREFLEVWRSVPQKHSEMCNHVLYPLRQLYITTTRMAGLFIDLDGHEALLKDTPNGTLWLIAYHAFFDQVCVYLKDVADQIDRPQIDHDNLQHYAHSLEMALMRLFRLLLEIKVSRDGKVCSLQHGSWTVSDDLIVRSTCQPRFSYRSAIEMSAWQRDIKFDVKKEEAIKEALNISLEPTNAYSHERYLVSNKLALNLVTEQLRRGIIYKHVFIPLPQPSHQPPPTFIRPPREVSEVKKRRIEPLVVPTPPPPIQQKDECIVCLDRPRTMMADECSHFCKCDQCIVVECPVCRHDKPTWRRVYT